MNLTLASFGQFPRCRLCQSCLMSALIWAIPIMQKLRVFWMWTLVKMNILESKWMRICVFIVYKHFVCSNFFYEIIVIFARSQAAQSPDATPFVESILMLQGSKYLNFFLFTLWFSSKDITLKVINLPKGLNTSCKIITFCVKSLHKDKEGLKFILNGQS